MPIDRMLFEKIMPRVENLLDMKGNYDYQDIVIRLVEQVAEKYTDIERFNIYKADEFIDMVIKKFKSKPVEFTKNVPSFIKQNKLLSIAVKESLSIEIFKEMFI